MKIESILRREDGTVVPMGNKSYHFAPAEDGRHICEVADQAHAERFLSIHEGFRVVEEVVAEPEAPKADGEEVKQRGGRKAKVEPEAPKADGEEVKQRGGRKAKVEPEAPKADGEE